MRSRSAEGTFEAAARSLHVTPSAVSQRIKTLETTLGRVLVTRSKPIQPTASGQTLLRVARQVQALMTEAGDAFEADPTTAAAVISVAVNADSLATGFCPRLPRWVRHSALTCDASTRIRPRACCATGRSWPL